MIWPLRRMMSSSGFWVLKKLEVAPEAGVADARRDIPAQLVFSPRRTSADKARRPLARLETGSLNSEAPVAAVVTTPLANTADAPSTLQAGRL
ncbi:MAG: hypothetical protein ABII82_06960, partial [Verrucomicrobiota bacterium]